MVDRSKWLQAVVGGYTASLCLYAPIAIVGYLVYGSFLAKTSTILEAIMSFRDNTKIAVDVCSGIMIAHIFSAFPIVINPVFQVVEKRFSNPSHSGLRELIQRIAIRGPIMGVLILVALFFPYFLDVMSLLSDISVSLTGFILPCLFYWKICHPPLWEKILLVIVIAFGVVGSTVGIYVSVNSLIDDISAQPNPFKDLFTFG